VFKANQSMNLSVSQTPWFKEAHEDHRRVILRYDSDDFFRSGVGSTHDTTIVFSKAIKDGTGTVIGVWAASLAVESLLHVFYKDGSAEGFPYPVSLKTQSGKKLLTIGEFNPDIPTILIHSTGFSRWPGGQWSLEAQMPAQFRYQQWMLLGFGSMFTSMLFVGSVVLYTRIFRSRLIRPLEAIESQIGSIKAQARISNREPEAPLQQPVESDGLSHEWLLHRDDELGDIARHLAEQTEAVRKHINQLVLLNESSRDIQEQVLSLPALLKRILSTAKSLTHARYAALGVFDESGTRLTQFITEGIDEETTHAIGDLPTGRGLLEALHKHAVLRLKDLTQHPKAVGFPPHHPAMHSFLGVSLRAHGKLYGRLYLTDKLLPTTTGQAEHTAEPAVGEFTDFDEQLIWVLAIQAGAAIETAGMIEEIRITQNRDRALLDSVEEGIYGIDLAGQCLFINRAAAKMLGYNQDALVGCNIHALIHHGQEDGTPCLETKCPMRRVLESHCGFPLESEMFRRKDGTVFPIMGTATPLQNESGEVTGAVVSFSDLTERRLLELQVRQGQKLEALGELAGRVAHDFNNLLTVMCGQSQLALLRNDLPASARSGIEEIKKAADRATALTSQLLMFSRQKPLARKVVDLHEVIQGVELLIRQMLGERVVFSIELADGPRSVKLDPGGFEQILINLAVNARDAMPNGGLLEIRSMSLDPATMEKRFPMHRSFGASIMITVRDTGVGMDKATQARIFEPFFTTKSVGRGTGLGLTTVARFIHENAGAVQVASEPGVGTTFTLLFPLVESAVDQRDAPALDVPIRGGDETILLVENDRTVRSLVATMLQSKGYHVLTANDGREGNQVANQYKGAIHALVSDVTMPHMNGPALAKSLCLRRPDLKTLFITGHAEDELDRQGISSEQADVLLKPFSKAALLEAVRRVLDEPVGQQFLPSAACGSACILIIDDNEQVNAMLQDMLSNEGYRVLVAPSGLKGISLLRQEPVNLLITDMLMPAMDGIELIQEARRLLPSLKIIAMSGGGVGLTPDTYLGAAQHLGASSVLVKPFSRESLLKTVREMLG
jgi:PAS domain S-box-containing protein